MNEFDYLAKAKKKMEKENYHEVISLCDEALKLNKDLSEAYDFRGNAKYELGQYEDAVNDFSQLIMREPYNAEHYYDRSWAYWCLDRSEDAIIDMAKALEIEPMTSLYYYDKARFEYWSGRNREAIVDITKGIELKPAGNKYLIRAYCYLELKMFDFALADYNSAIEFNPEYAAAYYRRGLLYKDFEKLELAQKDFKKAIELYSGYDDAMTALGFVRIQLGKKDAMKYFNKAIKVNSCADNYYCRVKARQKILIREDSLKKLSEGKLVQYGNDEIFNEKQAKDDIKDLNKAIALDEENVSCYKLRAERYNYLKEYTKAIEDLDTLMNIDPNDDYYYWARACAKFNFKHYKEAVEDINKYIELKNGIVSSCKFRIKGIANYNLGNYDEAISDLTKGIVDDTEYEPYYYRGLANYNLKNYRQSHSDFSKAIELKPDVESVFDEKIPLLIKLFLRKNKK